MREHRARTWMILLVGQVIYSFSGVFARQCPLPPVAICFYRMLFSVPLLFVPAMHQLRKLSRGDWILLLAGGCFMAIDFSLWTTAITRTTLVNVNLLANLNVLLIVPLSRVLFQEKAPPFFLYGGALAVIGAVILISGGGMPHAPGNFSGDFLAICSSVSYSIYFLFCKNII